jgi:steroid delta-isomerase
LTQWTEDFNAGRTDKVCDLLAKDARADVAGMAERDYAAICEVLTRSLNDKTRRYSYAKDIKEVLVSATSRSCGWSGP